MSALFGVDIAGVLLDSLGGQLRPLALHKISHTVGDYGEPQAVAIAHAGEGVRTKWSSNTMLVRGYGVGTSKIIILQDGIPAPAKGDEVVIDGERWAVLDIEQDPVGATWSVAAVAAKTASPEVIEADVWDGEAW